MRAPCYGVALGHRLAWLLVRVNRRLDSCRRVFIVAICVASHHGLRPTGTHTARSVLRRWLPRARAIAAQRRRGRVRTSQREFIAIMQFTLYAAICQRHGSTQRGRRRRTIVQAATAASAVVLTKSHLALVITSATAAQACASIVTGFVVSVSLQVAAEAAVPVQLADVSTARAEGAGRLRS